MNSNRIRKEIAATVSSTQQMPKKEEEGSIEEEDYVPYTIQCEIFR